MGFTKTFDVSVSISNETINSYLFKCANRLKPNDFTRSGKMSFKETIFFMLNSKKKSLQSELNNFFENILKRDDPISKQAFSEARNKIDPKAFIELNDAINEVIYETHNEYKLWNGYRVSAIDGSIIEIPNTELLRNEYGYIENQNAIVARAKVGCIFDVVNKIVLTSKIDKYKASERHMAMEMISEIMGRSNQKDLILFDRGYPSAELLSFLIENNIDFLMRSSRTYSKEIKNATKSDQMIEFKYKQKLYNARVIRFMLSSSEEEILITSLLDKNMTIEDFKELYFMRWGIEIKYDELKNRLQIENFTGTTKIAIEQDFYATIYLSNMVEMARSRSDELIEDKNNNKDLKYKQKTNLNILVGILKDKLIKMLLENSKRKRNKIFKEIMNQISRSTVPVRPGRHFKRNKKNKRGKYCINQKQSF